jgi:hypothetical protein
MQEHKHVVEVLQQAKEAAKKKDIITLKRLSDQTIHATTIYKDTDNVLVAILIYALSKLLEREESFDHKDFDKYLKYYLNTIDFSKTCVKKDDCDSFRDRVKEMMNVPGLSTEIKRSVKDVFRKARINKASKVYEHGISMEATAKLLGISLWELAEYTGQSGVHESREGKTLSVRDRVKNAMEIFS